MTSVKTGPQRGGQARTRLARRAVIDAARHLFVDRGYQTTTVDAISDVADVPAPTVYRLFGSKVGILKALLDVSIAGDDRPVSVPDRAEVAELLGRPDPAQRIAGLASVIVAINARSNDVYGILAGAAAADLAAATLYEEYQRQRSRGQDRVARSLARAGALRPGVRERDAADLIHGLGSPELYRLLVVERKWRPRRYERWLARTLADQLLEQPQGPRGSFDELP